MGSQWDDVWVPTLEGAFLTAYEGTQNEAWSLPILRKYDSKTEFTKIVDVGTVGKVRQFSGTRQATDPKKYTLQIQNLPYELSLDVDADDYRRDSLGAYEAKVAELGQKAGDHVNVLTINTLLTNPTCLDGAAFFSASHPVNGTTQKNLVTSSDIPALTTAGGVGLPTVIESANAILATVAYFSNFVDEVGDPVNGGARKFTVVTGNPLIWQSMIAAINSPVLAAGLTNPLVGLFATGWQITIEIDNRLGNTSTAFYVFRTDSVIKPIVWSEELPFEIATLGMTSDSYVNLNRLVWAGKMVRAVAPGRYQHAIKATLS
jgi:phage major head subunit gpT-like protein